MTLWQLHACADGFRAANGGGEPLPPAPSDEEFDAWVGGKR